VYIEKAVRKETKMSDIDHIHADRTGDGPRPAGTAENWAEYRRRQACARARTQRLIKWGEIPSLKQVEMNCERCKKRRATTYVYNNYRIFKEVMPWPACRHCAQMNPGLAIWDRPMGEEPEEVKAKHRRAGGSGGGAAVTTKNMFYRLNEDDNAVILTIDEGERVTRIDGDAYPVNSDLSVQYEHPEGIVLSISDALRLGILPEGTEPTSTTTKNEGEG
jgi:hypothetical protein